MTLLEKRGGEQTYKYISGEQTYNKAFEDGFPLHQEWAEAGRPVLGEDRGRDGNQTLNPLSITLNPLQDDPKKTQNPAIKRSSEGTCASG